MGRVGLWLLGQKTCSTAERCYFVHRQLSPLLARYAKRLPHLRAIQRGAATLWRTGGVWGRSTSDYLKAGQTLRTKAFDGYIAGLLAWGPLCVVTLPPGRRNPASERGRGVFKTSTLVNGLNAVSPA